MWDREGGRVCVRERERGLWVGGTEGKRKGRMEKLKEEKPRRRSKGWTERACGKKIGLEKV